MARMAAPAPAVTTAISTMTATVSHHPGLTPATGLAPTSIEAKLVILGSQGVGKTSLVNRFVNPLSPLPTTSQATIGASFITKRILDPDTNTTVRLQIWDTAGQERFRSISRLYYRGANACLLCYDVTSERSWEEMKGWLREMRDNCDLGSAGNGGAGMVVHIVGTKTDLVAANPDSRQVNFERTISYVADQFGGIIPSATSQSSTPPLSMRPTTSTHAALQSPDSKRSSGYWNQDLGWDSCHEISAKDNDGIEEVFRVIARKLVEQRNKKEAWEMSQTPAWPADGQNGSGDYFGSGGRDRYAGSGRDSTGSFRLGYGDKRRSWLGIPTMGLGGEDTSAGGGNAAFSNKDVEEAKRKGRCC